MPAAPVPQGIETPQPSRKLPIEVLRRVRPLILKNSSSSASSGRDWWCYMRHSRMDKQLGGLQSVAEGGDQPLARIENGNVIRHRDLFAPAGVRATTR